MRPADFSPRWSSIRMLQEAWPAAIPYLTGWHGLRPALLLSTPLAAGPAGVFEDLLKITSWTYRE